MCNILIDVIIGCINGVKTELHILHYTNGSLGYNYFQNGVIVSSLSGKDTTQSSFSTDCNAPTTRYDRETLCEPVNGLPVSVRFEYLTDGTVSPAIAYNLNGTPYTGAISELVACGTQKQYDYEDTIVYDNCIAVMQTIVRETGNATNITTIFYTKLDGTAHTLVGPLSEKPCNDAQAISISSELVVNGATITKPAGAKYAVISVIEGEAWIKVDGTIPTVGNGHPIYEGERLYLQIENEIDDFKFIGNPTASLYITYYDRPLLLSYS